MELVLFLIFFPLIAAFSLLIFRQTTARKNIVIISALVLIVATAYLLISNLNTGISFFEFDSEAMNIGMMVIDALLALYIVYLGFRHKKFIAPILMVAQVAIILYFELTYGHDLASAHNLFLDNLSIIMALIIGVVGSLICVYALGYMEDYHHHHHEVKKRIPFFFFIMFVFLSAMFGVVFANNILWLYFFWEITTICSFILIGYTQTKEAVKNAFRALDMNLLGGLAFAVAIVYLFFSSETVELSQLNTLNKSLIMLPVALMSFAGITKSAQFPFSGWLLGAMVAPTPTSALLHSSTMVKAGVYLIIRLSPVLLETQLGLMVALVGAISFLLTSCIAISQSDAKKVLAYSTIANLGLIVTCAGIGNYETVWAAILLMIFHAVAKSLMFLSVGTVEHNLGNRDIETMEGLITKMPWLALTMVIGIAGMFLAPFGMLISKWAALEGLVRANPILTVFLAFGSAATLFFWTKWMGKILMVKVKPANFKEKVPKTERSVLILLAVLTVGICLVFPLVSKQLIEPYLMDIYRQAVSLAQGNIIIMLMMMGLVFILPLSFLFNKDVNYVEAYLGGTNVLEKEKFYGSLGLTRELKIRNYYLENYFGEGNLFNVGVISCTVLIVIMLGVEIL